jgi:hypothetical protein
VYCRIGRSAYPYRNYTSSPWTNQTGGGLKLVPTGGPVVLTSEQREREGEAPSGYAGGGGDVSPLTKTGHGSF